MSAGLNITAFGFKELQAKLEALPQTIQKEAGKLIFDGAQRIRNAAVANAPVNFGILKGLIVAEKEGEFGANVQSLANYSGYVEWGTGSRVSIASDPDEAAYEETFKTGKDTVGRFAKPFLFPALYEVTPTIIADVEAMLQEELNR